MPNALVYIVAFAIILAAVLLLAAISNSFRKLYLATLLIPIGIFELSIVEYYISNAYYIPHEIFIICFGTVTSGIVIPLFYAARNLLSKTAVRILLFISGWVELALGLNRLPSFVYFYPFYDVVLLIVFATIGIYSIVISVFLSVTDRMDVQNEPELV